LRVPAEIELVGLDLTYQKNVDRANTEFAQVDRDEAAKIGIPFSNHRA
jgi:hypothetical protein